MKTLISYLQLFGALFAIIALGEIAAVHSASDWINRHHTVLAPPAFIGVALGLVLMFWGLTGVGDRYGRAMTSREAEELAGFKKGNFKGKAIGRTVDPVEWSFAEMKGAWRAGLWWRDPDMRRKYLITAGLLFLVLSAFSVFGIVLEPPAAKLMVAGAVVYSLIRTATSFLRA